jgi:Mn-dependent DtxR family transcriptional regulator
MLSFPSTSTKGRETMANAIEEFIETMGRHFEEEGAPRIAGRLFGLLMVHEEPCSLDDVAERLQVSKGSASTNARLLEQWGIAERTSRPGDRRDYYQLTPDMESRILERQMEHVTRMRARLHDGLSGLPDVAEPIRERFRSMIAFQDRAVERLGEALGQTRGTARPA